MESAYATAHAGVMDSYTTSPMMAGTLTSGSIPMVFTSNTAGPVFTFDAKTLG